MLKIIAGEFRSRSLLTPPDEEVTRPYTQRVKESVFNLLREWIEGARVLDLFAGVGTVGLEALSRGAEQVVMVELDRQIFELLEQNIASLGCGDRATAVCGDSFGSVALLRAPKPVDLVFVDPPYRMMIDPDQRERVLGLVGECLTVAGEQCVLVLRSPLGPKDVELTIAGLIGPEVHRYSKDMWVLMYGRNPAPIDGTDHPDVPSEA